MRVILDTNIIISGIGWNGTPQKILSLLVEGKFKIVVSPEILKEIETVFSRKKFKNFDKHKIYMFLIDLIQLGEVISPKNKIKISRDTKDDKFFELALAANVKIIVSGDEDLLSIKKYKDIMILTPKEFLEMIN